MSVTERQPRRWTAAEDQTLREHVDAQQEQGGGRDWCQIALALPGRTNKDCRKRWHNSVAEGLRKGQWSKSEDQLLTHGVHRYGPQWTKVATCVSSRSADQCAKRWQQSLDPRLDRSEWRENEDVALLAAVDRLGRHWKDIQEQHLPHRSKNCVKNRYSVLARRTATQLIPYEDSMESSSSDPGTPLQIEPIFPLNHGLVPNLQNPPQAPYMQRQTTPADSNNALWPWSGNVDPNMLMIMDYHEPPLSGQWPTYQNHPLPTDHNRWNGIQTTTISQLHPQYTHSSNHHIYDYTHATQQSPYQFPLMPYATPVETMVTRNTPTARLPSSLVQRRGYAQQRTRGDSAPFG